MDASEDMLIDESESEAAFSDFQNHNLNSGSSQTDEQMNVPVNGEMIDKIEKLKIILTREFDREIENKRNEVLLINERILEALRNLTNLKYVATFTYYERNVESQPPKVQTRLHPAVKKLLPRGYKTSRREREPLQINSEETSDCSNNTHTVISETNSSKIFTYDSNSSTSSVSSTVDERVRMKPPTEAEKEKSVETMVNNHKETTNEVCRVGLKLIVGNTSKWISPDTREDGATHKWMVYVRDEKQDDLSVYISRVRFYLHESYKPNNIIDVNKSPFVLSRRGWGEFTIKVRLFFCHPLNKPVDVMHKIKLDQTFSGVQTLGSETVVSLNLYKAGASDADKESFSSVFTKMVNVDENVYDVDTDSDGTISDIDITDDDIPMVYSEQGCSFSELVEAGQSSSSRGSDNKEIQRIITMEHDYT